MRNLDDLHFAEILYQTLIDEDDLLSDTVKKHVWYHDLHIEESKDGYQVKKRIYNAYDSSLQLRTRTIAYSRISNVE